MDKRRFEIIYHLLIFAYFFGDSDLLQNGGGATSNFYDSDYIYKQTGCHALILKVAFRVGQFLVL